MNSFEVISLLLGLAALLFLGWVITISIVKGIYSAVLVLSRRLRRNDDSMVESQLIEEWIRKGRFD